MSTSGTKIAGLSEIRSSNLVDMVFEQLRRAIVDKSLPPGLRVTEDGLAKHLNVSKTPVREALLRLRQVGLIEDDGRRGVRVIAPSRDAVEQAFAIREALEVFSARVAAEDATSTQSEGILAAAELSLAGARSGNREQFVEWNEAFHTRVVDTVGNARLAGLTSDACALISTLRSRDIPEAEASILCGEAHVRIAIAIRDGDPDAAAAHMQGHIRHIREYVIEALEIVDEPPVADLIALSNSSVPAGTPGARKRRAAPSLSVD